MIVWPACLIARVVAPHPVIPLLRIQFAGISFIHSDKCLVHLGAFKITVCFIVLNILLLREAIVRIAIYEN